MNTEAKPWYQSKIVLVLLAGILFQLAGRLGILPEGYTTDNMVEFLLVVGPMVVAAVSRFGATKKVVATKAAADSINN